MNFNLILLTICPFEWYRNLPGPMAMDYNPLGLPFEMTLNDRNQKKLELFQEWKEGKLVTTKTKVIADEIFRRLYLIELREGVDFRSGLENSPCVVFKGVDSFILETLLILISSPLHFYWLFPKLDRDLE